MHYLKAIRAMVVIMVSCAVLARPLVAQSSSQGIISGVLYDANTGQVVVGATVEVVGLPDTKATTGSDGAFRLAVPGGTYALRITATHYLPVTVREVSVQPGAEADASTVLAPADAVTSVDVVETVSSVWTSAAAMVEDRKLAATISDGLSSDEIRASTASDAAAVLERVTGVSVVDGGYVYVRGLGERYSATMLNNALIPSTEPERRVVPLDLFPANLVDTIKVLKTYTPDLPGEFSGGLVQLHTIEFPTRRRLRVSSSFGFNTRTTFQKFQSYRGGRFDFFGFDDGIRSLPRTIPATERLFPGNFSEEQFQQFGRSFPVNWEPEPILSVRPQQSYSVVGGDTFGRLGLVGALTFSNTPQRYSELQRYFVNDGRRPIILTEYPDYEADLESVRMGGILNAALRVTPSSKLVFRNTLARDADKEARSFFGYNGGVDTYIHSQRLRYIERQLFATGVEGSHALAGFRNSLLKWQFTRSASLRDEPDMREVFRTPRADGTLAFSAMPLSGLRFYNHLRDRINEPAAEWSLPFYRPGLTGQFKTGFRSTFRRRDFWARRFRFTPVRTFTLDFTQPSNVLFGPENIRPDGFVVRENTRGTDAYDAEMHIHAGFAMADVSLGSRWRLIGGVRIEDSSTRVTTIDPLVPGSVPVLARLENRDPLPAVNVIYALTPRQNLRYAYRRTLSRPDFRELSPFDFTNVLGGFNVVGNPNLRRATIDNLDFRWEWFLGGGEMLAVGAFYKRFQDPIEATIQATTSDLRQSFLNADSARNAGVEVELRRDLGKLSRRLSGVNLVSNFTLVDSIVKIPDTQKEILTSLRRPLVAQSRYVANLIAEWAKPNLRSNVWFSLHHVSRRLSDVGSMGLPDIYQEANTYIDLVYQFNLREDGGWSLRFSAENLGDNHYRWTQAGMLQRSYRLGRTFSIGTHYTIF